MIPKTSTKNLSFGIDRILGSGDSIKRRTNPNRDKDGRISNTVSYGCRDGKLCANNTVSGSDVEMLPDKLRCSPHNLSLSYEHDRKEGRAIDNQKYKESKRLPVHRLSESQSPSPHDLHRIYQNQSALQRTPPVTTLTGNADIQPIDFMIFPHPVKDVPDYFPSVSVAEPSRKDIHSKRLAFAENPAQTIPGNTSPSHSPIPNNTKPLSAFQDVRLLRKAEDINDSNNNLLTLQNSHLYHSTLYSDNNRLPFLLPKPFHVPDSNKGLLPSPPRQAALSIGSNLSMTTNHSTATFLEDRDSFVSAFRLTPQYYQHDRLSVPRDLGKDNPVLIGFRAGLPVLSGLCSTGQTHLWKDADPRRSTHPSCHGRCHQTKRKKPRTSFTRLQILELEKRFHRQKYLASNERSSLAKGLKMTDAQVKTWFQNRRTKWRRQTAEERDAERQAATRLMLTLDTEPCKTSLEHTKDTLCLGNSSLHALQNMQPWSDDDIDHDNDVRDDDDNDDDDDEIDVKCDDKED